MIIVLNGIHLIKLIAITSQLAHTARSIGLNTLGINASNELSAYETAAVWIAIIAISEQIVSDSVISTAKIGANWEKFISSNLLK